MSEVCGGRTVGTHKVRGAPLNGQRVNVEEFPIWLHSREIGTTVVAIDLAGDSLFSDSGKRDVLRLLTELNVDHLAAGNSNSLALSRRHHLTKARHKVVFAVSALVVAILIFRTRDRKSVV